MKFYRVIPEYLYGADKEQKLAAQENLAQQYELIRDETGAVVCDAETALALLHAGFCGPYDVQDHIKLVLHTEARVPAEVIQLLERISDKVIGRGAGFNERCNQEQPSNWLSMVTETMLLTDSCTDQLQAQLADGWRIIAVQPQPDQRRPDYILGRGSIPRQAYRG